MSHDETRLDLNGRQCSFRLTDLGTVKIDLLSNPQIVGSDNPEQSLAQYITFLQLVQKEIEGKKSTFFLQSLLFG